MSEQKQITRVQSACKSIEKLETQLTQLLPDQIPTKKFIQTAKMAIQNPMIAEKINDGSLDMPSLYSACQKAAADGLVLDSREAALTVYWNKTTKRNEAQYMPMVYGIIKRVKNSGEVSSITAHVVYKNDKFKHIKAPVEEVHHESVELDEEQGEPIGVYAVAVLNDGERKYSVMRKSQVMSVRDAAKTKYIWDGSFADQMWEKTAIRRLAKRLPSTADALNSIFKSDDETFDYDNAKDITPKDDEKTETRAASVVMNQSQNFESTRDDEEKIEPEIIEEILEGEAGDVLLTAIDDDDDSPI